jgi:hypothetical protein
VRDLHFNSSIQRSLICTGLSSGDDFLYFDSRYLNILQKKNLNGFSPAAALAQLMHINNSFRFWKIYQARWTFPMIEDFGIAIICGDMVSKTG